MTVFRSTTGFTLIELLVVIAIIGLLSTMAVVSLNSAREKARDAKRLDNIKKVITAINLFYDDNGHYPNSSDGVSNSGEVLGDDAGVMESLLSEYYDLPADPSYDGSTGDNDYFYGYDPAHNVCDPVISINRFENQSTVDEYSSRDTSSGGDMQIDTAHYNYCFPD